jgi:hypothetical protein
MCRVLKSGALLTVNEDYFINPDIIPGHDYRDDIVFLKNAISLFR